MRQIIVLCILLTTILAQNGETLYTSLGCYGCHGISAKGTADYPRLAGKSSEYLKKKLYALKKGIGHTSKRNLMIPFAKAMTTVQIDAITKYLSKLNPNKKDKNEVDDEYLGGME